MEYIFTYGDDIPDGYGFSLFGTGHIVWLAVIVLTTAVLVCVRDFNKEKLLGFIGDFLLFLIVFRIAALSVMGKMSVYELPLHMCSLTGFLCFIHSRTGRDSVGQIIYEVGLPGTVFALVFPNWTEYPALNFISVQSFLFHGGIVVYAAICLADGKIIPGLYGIWYSVVFLIAVTAPIYVFDRIFGVNYLFVIRPSKGSPLEWFEELMGNPGYLFGYALLVAAVLIFMCGLAYLDRFIRRKLRKG